MDESRGNRGHETSNFKGDANQFIVLSLFDSALKKLQPHEFDLECFLLLFKSGNLSNKILTSAMFRRNRFRVE